MENRQTEENILSEYQKYSLTKKKYKVLCKKSVPFSTFHFEWKYFVCSDEYYTELFLIKSMYVSSFWIVSKMTLYTYV